MPIPDFVDGVLPVGIHDCTTEEVRDRFGRFQRSDRRMRLTDKLMEYLTEARASGIVSAVIIDGSYATNRDEPEDIDLIVVLAADFDFTQPLRPYQIGAIDPASIRRKYRFDAFAYKHGEDGLNKLVAVFAAVPDKYSGWTGRTHKGMVRVSL
jgi:predicted nucleotidyltransferase